MKSSHLLVTFFLALGFVAQDVSFIYAMERSKASPASPSGAWPRLTSFVKQNLHWLFLYFASQRSINEQLLQSAMEGNIDGVRAAIDQGADVFAIQNNDGYTALHLATVYCHTDTVKALLNVSGIDAATLITIQNRNGRTALHEAAVSGLTDIVNALLAGMGPDRAATLITIQDCTGRTALHMAAAGGHTDIVTALLNVPGIDAATLMTIKNRDGNTALDLAKAQGNTDTVKALLYRE